MSRRENTAVQYDTNFPIFLWKKYNNTQLAREEKHHDTTAASPYNKCSRWASRQFSAFVSSPNGRYFKIAFQVIKKTIFFLVWLHLSKFCRTCNIWYFSKGDVFLFFCFDHQQTKLRGNDLTGRLTVNLPLLANDRIIQSSVNFSEFAVFHWRVNVQSFKTEKNTKLFPVDTVDFG